MTNQEKALKLHEQLQGKLETVSKVPVKTREDLALAYTPGVAEPCKVIARDPSQAYVYTMKANTVAVVSDGSAVLGLGNIGPKAAMPVMEGKAVLFKEFGGINAVPICLDTQDTEEIIRAVTWIAPGFGGINLEDISAPRCFEIEERLKEILDIPVFHDDQHGTAIVVLAGIINALKVTGKRREDCRVVINGAGSAGIAIARLLLTWGFSDLLLCDRAGILCEGDPGLNWMQEKMTKVTNRSHQKGTLADAMRGADIFVGRLRSRHRHAGNGIVHEPGRHSVRHGQPRSGNHAGSGPTGGGQSGGNRAQRFSQSSQQRGCLSRHFQGCPGGTRPSDHGRDEAGRRQSHRRSGARRSSGRRSYHAGSIRSQGGRGCGSSRQKLHPLRWSL